MSFPEMGPQLKLPINVTNGSMPLCCVRHIFQKKILPFKVRFLEGIIILQIFSSLSESNFYKEISKFLQKV